jgi:hypothetical protein
VLLVGTFHALRTATGALGLEGWAAAIPAGAAALAVYLGYLFARHPGTADNLRYALALLSPGDFIRFLRSGLRGPARP